MMADNNIHKLRIKAGFTQAELAQRAGVSVRMIQKYESGDRDILSAGLITCYRIAQALGCSVVDLIRKDIAVRINDDVIHPLE